MEAVITVVGNDQVGILAQICAACAACNVNVEEVTQRILRGTFAMIMLVDMTKSNVEFTEFARKMQNKGSEMGVDVHCTRQELYDAMHRI
ncbi:MAG: ACT domain-containing protein [Ruthenibacterium sp.]